ncbi:MFS transporter [Actinomycetota bacterium]|nr:MFS transporter [Actinomycetota bacterium]
MTDTYNGFTRGRAWIAMICTYLMGLTIILCQFQIPPIMQPLVASFGSDSLVDASLLMTMFGVVQIILSIPISALLIKIGFRPGAIIALGCVAVGSLIGGFSTSFEVLLCARVIEGIGGSFGAAAGPAIITLMFPPNKRGLPMGIWVSWVSTGVFLSNRLASTITGLMGIRGMFWWVIGVAIIVLIIFLVVVRYPRELERSGDNTKKEKVTGAYGFRKAWLLCAMFVCYSMVLSSANSLLPTYIAQTFGIASTVAAGEVSWFSLVGIFAGVAWGFLINYWMRKKQINVGIIVLCVCVTLGFGLLFTVPSLGPVLVIFMVVAALLTAGWPTIAFALAPTTVNNVVFVTATMALLNIGTRIGSAFGPLASAAIVENGGWAAMPLPTVSCGVLLVIGSIVWFVWSKKPSTKEQESIALADQQERQT